MALSHKIDCVGLGAIRWVVWAMSYKMGIMTRWRVCGGQLVLLAGVWVRFLLVTCMKGGEVALNVCVNLRH